MRGVKMGIQKEVKQSIANVETILSRSRLTDAERNVIMEELCKALYKRCTDNALICAFTEFFKEAYPEEYKTYLATYTRSVIFNNTYLRRMKETWPYETRY